MVNVENSAHRTGVVDSLCANEFAVELDGQPVTGVFKIEGFVPFRLVTAPPTTGSNHPGMRLDTPPFRISRMVQRNANLPFNQWIQATIEAVPNSAGALPTKTLTIIAMDDGVAVRRWAVEKATITEVSYSDFDTGSGALVEETCLIQYASIKINWKP